MQDVEPEEDYILVIDADMIMRAPFIPERLGVKPGWAISAYFGYLKGVSNELALRHVPHVLPRNDTKAGPVGRRGDQVWKPFRFAGLHVFPLGVCAHLAPGAGKCWMLLRG